MGNERIDEGATKMKKNYIQTFFINSYRSAAFVALTGILLTAVWYLFTLLFYAGATSWAAPVVLSPSQDKVLSLQPQIANMDNLLTKQKVDLVSLEEKIKEQENQKLRLLSIKDKITKAVESESNRFAQNSKSLSGLLIEKKKEISDSEKVKADFEKIMQTVDAELATGLITKDQAIQRKMSAQSAISAITDSKTQFIQLQNQAVDLDKASSTLKGGNSSLAALSSIQQIEQLNTSIAQVEIEIAANKQNAEALKKVIKESERVITIAKSSPYYHAMHEKVTVLFMPYDNLNHAKTGAPVYDCLLSVILCKKAGEIEQIYDAEEYARHPLYKTDLRGRLVKVKFQDENTERSTVVFVNSRPLFF